MQAILACVFLLKYRHKNDDIYSRGVSIEMVRLNINTSSQMHIDRMFHYASPDLRVNTTRAGRVLNLAAEVDLRLSNFYLPQLGLSSDSTRFSADNWQNVAVIGRDHYRQFRLFDQTIGRYLGDGHESGYRFCLNENSLRFPFMMLERPVYTLAHEFLHPEVHFKFNDHISYLLDEGATDFLTWHFILNTFPFVETDRFDVGLPLSRHSRLLTLSNGIGKYTKERGVMNILAAPYKSSGDISDFIKALLDEEGFIPALANLFGERISHVRMGGFDYWQQYSINALINIEGTLQGWDRETDKVYIEAKQLADLSMFY